LSARPSCRVRPLPLALALAVALVALIPLSVRVGIAPIETPQLLRGALAALGLAEPLDPAAQTIAELRIWRSLTAAFVGAALALSGGLVQGLFRNPLASPSLLGVTGGASLGAALAILALGGYAPRGVLEYGGGPATVAVPLCSFAGALAAVLFVAGIAAPHGRLSTPTLLLVGIAVNMCVAGAFAALQSLTLRDWEVSRAILAWTFGTLDDRSGLHAGTAGAGLLLALAAVPFVARELDLLQGGEADAQSLGVDVLRTKLIGLVAAAVAAACAVAVAGQIAFVGLVVPHLVRLASTRSHKSLLWLCALAGAVFLLGTDLAQRALLGAAALQPGVVMSLIGGPFFLFLLIRHRREVGAW
jgi:iron complex transport system permease protein